DSGVDELEDRFAGGHLRDHHLRTMEPRAPSAARHEDVAARSVRFVQRRSSFWRFGRFASCSGRLVNAFARRFVSRPIVSGIAVRQLSERHRNSRSVRCQIQPGTWVSCSKRMMSERSRMRTSCNHIVSHPPDRGYGQSRVGNKKKYEARYSSVNATSPMECHAPDVLRYQMRVNAANTATFRITAAPYSIPRRCFSPITAVIMFAATLPPSATKRWCAVPQAPALRSKNDATATTAIHTPHTTR